MGRKKPRLPSLVPETVEVIEEKQGEWEEFSPTAPFSTGTIPRYSGSKPPLHHRESSHHFSEYTISRFDPSDSAVAEHMIVCDVALSLTAAAVRQFDSCIKKELMVLVKLEEQIK